MTMDNYNAGTKNVLPKQRRQRPKREATRHCEE
jgi:hypothetical protein